MRVIIGSGITSIGFLAFDNDGLSSVCIERARAGLTLASIVFPSDATIDYQSDGDCTD